MKKMQDVAINADHKVFFLMIIFNVIMLVSSIIQMILGKADVSHQQNLLKMLSYT